MIKIDSSLLGLSVSISHKPPHDHFLFQTQNSTVNTIDIRWRNIFCLMNLTTGPQKRFHKTLKQKRKTICIQRKDSSSKWCCVLLTPRVSCKSFAMSTLSCIPKTSGVCVVGKSFLQMKSISWIRKHSLKIFFEFCFFRDWNNII